MLNVDNRATKKYPHTQRAEYGFTKEYASNHNGDPYLWVIQVYSLIKMAYTLFILEIPIFTLFIIEIPIFTLFIIEIPIEPQVYSVFQPCWALWVPRSQASGHSSRTPPPNWPCSDILGHMAHVLWSMDHIGTICHTWDMV